jgi:TatD DNase family protein
MRWIEIAKIAIRDFNDCSVKTTIGYHPGECWMEEPTVIHEEIITEKNIQKKIDDLKILYEANKEYIVAIGECGIDIYYPGTEKQLPLQKKLFTLQCDLARELHLPLVVHVRKDFDSAFEILKNYTDLSIHFHCRSFGPEEITRLQDLKIKKLFIGFCGNVTYKNAQNLRDSLAQVPFDQLLIETDAPWLSPQTVRGMTNHPANVQYIYEFVAQQYGISIDQLCENIEKNYKILYIL